MSRLHFLIYSLMCLLLAVGIWYTHQLHHDLHLKEAELAVAQADIVTLTEQLGEYEQLLQEKELRLFSSVEELTSWLEADKTNLLVYDRDKFNCIDFAFTLQENARQDGYVIQTETLPISAHWVNLVLIGDTVYVIEPQNDQIIITKKVKVSDD